MQTLDLQRQTPSLAAWSRTARPVRFGMFREDASVQHDVETEEGSADLDDVLFGGSSAALFLGILALAVAAFIA